MEALVRRLQALLDGDVDVVATTPLSGGDVAEVTRVRLRDGRDLVVKRTTTDPSAEADGLAAIGAAGADTPEVVVSADDLLVLTYVDKPGDPATLGRAVARMHQAVGDAFGWHRDNFIGPLVQRNPSKADWVTFWRDHRIEPLLSVVDGRIATRIERAIDDRLPTLLDHGAVPSLVHGDLWSGNIIAHRWLIDPAVHYADRELDLAMLALFGGIPATFLDGYTSVWPLDPGWRDRQPALQLYHLLVHVALFGASYVPGIEHRLDVLGW